MNGVMLRGRPALIVGASTLPNSHRLDRILAIARSLQPAAAAISELLSSSLIIISRINTSVDFARLGAMVFCTAGGSANQETEVRNGKVDVGHLGLQLLVLQALNNISR